MALGPVTIDASVFLSANNPAEVHQIESHLFLDTLSSNARPVVLPTLVVPEVGAAAYRVGGSGETARSLALSLTRIPGVIFVPLDEQMGEASLEIAVEGALKGSDAVYAATARRFGATLVTLDRQQRTRLPADVRALYPWEALEDSRA
ncbi:MAG: type II toxin-antitoxin system VapC family toxin [Thermoleophilia bacterium]